LTFSEDMIPRTGRESVRWPHGFDIGDPQGFSSEPGTTSWSAEGPASDDVEAVLRFAVDGLDEGYGVALATLVEIRGGAARALGSQMAVRSDALYRGYLSGGCVEAVIAAEALQAIATGVDRCVRVGSGSPFFDIALPCGGGITVAIHVLRNADALKSVICDLASRQRSALRYDPLRQSLQPVAFRVNSTWAADYFFTAYRPRPRIVLFGRSVEVETPSRAAMAVGYDVVSFGPAEHSPLAQADIDEHTAVAVLHHEIDHEAPVLKAAFAANPFYIGCLGSMRTHARRRSMLNYMGFDRAQIDRIKAPIGIFPQARDAASIALSVLGDIAAAWTRNVNKG
jgi:xanthine dehydrogenase accessory factor